MSDMLFEFEHQGRIVRPGQMMYVAPAYWWQAGPQGRVERYHGDTVTLRSDNGAAPTVPLTALSWDPLPETVAYEELQQAGFDRPTSRDALVWMAARRLDPASDVIAGNASPSMPIGRRLPSEAEIDEYLDDYEMVGEDDTGQEGSYCPTDREKTLIKDAIMGLLGGLVHTETEAPGEKTQPGRA